MRLIDRLERKMGRFYINGLMKYICLGMLGVFILDLLPLGQVSASALLCFSKGGILSGEVWRLITFLFLPPQTSPIFMVFALYFNYFLGTALENHWGARRFCLYYLIGWLGCLLGGFISGYAPNTVLNLSLFLAFAVLYPDMQVTLFFFVPIQVKYIAFLDVALLIYDFIIMPSWLLRVSMLLGMLPFFLFFSRDLYYMVRRLYYRIKNGIRQ